MYVYIIMKQREIYVLNPLQQNCLLNPNSISCSSSYGANVLLWSEKQHLTSNFCLSHGIINT